MFIFSLVKKIMNHTLIHEFDVSLVADCRFKCLIVSNSYHSLAHMCAKAHKKEIPNVIDSKVWSED